MYQQQQLDDVLVLLSELTAELKMQKEHLRNDDEFAIQKESIMKIRKLVLLLDEMYNQRPMLIVRNGRL